MMLFKNLHILSPSCHICFPNTILSHSTTQVKSVSLEAQQNHGEDKQTYNKKQEKCQAWNILTHWHWAKFLAEL